MKLESTTRLIETGTYFASSPAFFEHFPGSYQAVHCQILKLETRQTYEEPGNDSFEAMRAGDWKRSMQLLEQARSVDKELYANLAERGVDFVRCRPLKFPLSDYLRWELEIYKFNARMCERIFCCNYDALDFVFRKFARHDFMVFDSRVAFIHDYDDVGLIAGGWKLDDLDAIMELQKLFVFIKSYCQPFQKFL